MKVTVEVDWDLCQHHGQCCYMAPETFELDANGRLRVLSETPGPNELADLEDAADACPVQAITVSALEE